MQSSLVPAASDSDNEEWGEWEDWENDGAGDSKGDSKQVVFDDNDPATWGEFVEEFKHTPSGETHADTEKSAIVLQNKNLIIHMSTFLDARTFQNLLLLNKLFHEVISSYEGDIRELKRFIDENKIEIPNRKEWPKNSRKRYTELLNSSVDPAYITNALVFGILKDKFHPLIEKFKYPSTLKTILLFKFLNDLTSKNINKAKKHLHLLTRGVGFAYQNQQFEIVDPRLLAIFQIPCSESHIDVPTVRLLLECGILPPASSIFHLDKFFGRKEFKKYINIFKENGFGLLNMANAIRELHIQGYNCKALKRHLLQMIPRELGEPSAQSDLIFAVVASFKTQDRKIDFQLFNKLLEVGINILSVDENGNTFLQRCLLNDILIETMLWGHDTFPLGSILEAIIRFREKGSNDRVFLNLINHKNNEGMTLLMMAAEKRQNLLAGFLLEKGANCLAENVRGETALDIARCADDPHFGMIVNLSAETEKNNIRLMPVSQFGSQHRESKNASVKDDTQQAIIKILVKRYFNAMPHPKFLPQLKTTSFFNANKQFVDLKSELLNYLQILQTTKMNYTEISETLDRMQQDAHKRSGLGTKEFDSLVKMLDDIRAMFGLPVIIPEQSYRFF